MTEGFANSIGRVATDRKLYQAEELGRGVVSCGNPILKRKIFSVDKALQGGSCFAGVTAPSLSSSILRTIKLVLIQTFAVHVYLLRMLKDGMDKTTRKYRVSGFWVGVDTLVLSFKIGSPPYQIEQILLQVGKKREGNSFRYKKADIDQWKRVVTLTSWSRGGTTGTAL